MSNQKPTPEMIEKLPKWAQNHISHLEMAAESADQMLKDRDNGQTQSNVYVPQHGWTNSGNVFTQHYLQTSRVVFEFAGVKLDVYLRSDRDGDESIDLTYSGLDGKQYMGEVAFVPQAYNLVRLQAQAYMNLFGSYNQEKIGKHLLAKAEASEKRRKAQS